jgi:hypothetical protein
LKLGYCGPRDFGVRMQVQENFINARPATYLQPDLEHGNASYGNQAFGDDIGQRLQPGTVASREDERFHDPERRRSQVE